VSTVGPITVRVVRHGESVANVERVFSYRIHDEGLTEEGRRQAELVATYLAGLVERPALVVSSPLRRALETAAPIASALEAEMLVDEGLREVNVGDLDGTTGEDSWAAHDRVFEAWTAGDADARMPGGETRRELAARVEGALLRAIRAAAGRSLVVVAHGGTLYQGVRTLLPGIVDDDATAWVGNASVTELSLGIEDDRLTGHLVAWAQDGHLVEATVNPDPA
jgi:probable phosphoglycerate mutase